MLLMTQELEAFLETWCFQTDFEALRIAVEENNAVSDILTTENQVLLEWGRFMSSIRSLGAIGQWKKVENIIETRLSKGRKLKNMWKKCP